MQGVYKDQVWNHYKFFLNVNTHASNPKLHSNAPLRMEWIKINQPQWVCKGPRVAP